jgi:hypothetical protein
LAHTIDVLAILAKFFLERKFEKNVISMLNVFFQQKVPTFEFFFKKSKEKHSIIL